MSYRTGRKVTRNLYEGERLVGQCQTDENALRIVAADAEIERLRAALVGLRTFVKDEAERRWLSYCEGQDDEGTACTYISEAEEALRQIDAALERK